MILRKLASCGIALFLSIAVPLAALADDHTDALSKCLVSATTPDDQTVFIKWMFATLSLHPDVAPMAHVTDQQRDSLNKDVAALMMRLFTKDCPSQVHDVVLFDGPSAVESSFEIFGRSAMLGLMSNQKVRTGLQSYSKYMDKDKLMRIFSGQQPAPGSSSH